MVDHNIGNDMGYMVDIGNDMVIWLIIILGLTWVYGWSVIVDELGFVVGPDMDIWLIRLLLIILKYMVN